MTPKKKTSRVQPPGSTIITIKGQSGDVAGHDIVKDNVFQSGEIGAGANVQMAAGGQGTTQAITVSGLSQADLTALKAELRPLQQKVDALPLPAAEKAEAQAKVQDLERELTVADRKPKATTIMYLGDWLLEHLPDVAETVADVFLGPIVGKVVGAAGDLAAEWVKERFSKPKPAAAGSR